MKHDLVLRQSGVGYRYNRDSFLLAHFFSPRQMGDRLLDVGAGVGVLSLLIYKRYPSLGVTLLELQSELAAQARCNCVDSGAPCEVVEGDLCDSSLFAAASFDAIVSNPPYYKVGSGKQNPQRGKAIARHELRMTLDDLLAQSGRLLRRGGRLSLSMIMERRDELLSLLPAYGFGETRFCAVRSFAHSPPRLFLSELTKGGEGAKVMEPPLILKNGDGGDSEQFIALQSALLGEV